MRKITQFLKVAVARLLFAIILILSIHLLIWPAIGDQATAWIEAKIAGSRIP